MNPTNSEEEWEAEGRNYRSGVTREGLVGKVLLIETIREDVVGQTLNVFLPNNCVNKRQRWRFYVPSH